MGADKRKIGADEIIEEESSDDSDVSMSDSDTSENSDGDIIGQRSSADENEDNITQNDQEEEEEEDEVIKAIRRENQRQRDHPPAIQCEDYIMDISFHPQQNILAVADIVGDVILYKYSFEENTITRTLELHTKACRDIEFSYDGKVLFSTGKDKTIMLSDVESGQLIAFYSDAHAAAPHCLSILNEHLFATGDEDGCVKLWDKRQKDSVFILKKNEDYISDIITNEANNYLLCSSGDGSLTTMDLQNRKFVMQSEEFQDELTCLGLFRRETKLVAGTSKGSLLMYNWHEFGLHSDLFPGSKFMINGLIPVTENIVVTVSDDGNLRAMHIFPHRHLGIVGQHNMAVENVDICNDGKFIASSSHSNDIKFWNIQYFEDFEKVSHKHNKHNKRKELENNLPSSKVRNVGDFFNDL